MKDQKNLNTSRFILPYIFDKKKDANELPFDVNDWKEYPISTKYLSRSVYEIFSPGDGVCKNFSLNDSARLKYGMPPRNVLVTMESKMYGAMGSYSFFIVSHRILQFESGVGFLVMDVQFTDDDFSKMVDINFCLSNIFTNEHDGGNKDNNLSFYYIGTDGPKFFSIKNSFYKALNVEKYVERLKLFPSSTRKRLITYSSVISTKIDETQTKKLLYCLGNSLHGKIQYTESSDSGIIFSSFAGQSWYVGTNGAVSVASTDSENEDFVKKVHKRNVDLDYFSIFILALHEREIMLEYNYLAVHKRKKPKELIDLKPRLLDADILYSFNTISVEASYQEFYEHLRSIFNLDNLRSDIRDVIENVESHVNDQNDRKINTILTAISFLALFSALTDGIGFADRLQTGDPFGLLQWGIIAAIAVIIGIAIIILKKRR